MRMNIFLKEDRQEALHYTHVHVQSCVVPPQQTTALIASMSDTVDDVVRLVMCMRCRYTCIKQHKAGKTC